LRLNSTMMNVQPAAYRDSGRSMVLIAAPVLVPGY
jgi:hypothetical protein